jgi:hypothetical protein
MRTRQSQLVNFGIVILLATLFSSGPAYADNQIQIVVSGPDSDGITNVGICFTNPSELSGTVTYNIDNSGSGAFLKHSGTPACPSYASGSNGFRLTSGVTYNYSATASNNGKSFSASISYTAPAVDPAIESARLAREKADTDFRAAQDVAIGKATLESQAWNAANPGKQKCIQWGPIVHANGVSTASGGVCANPVAPGADASVTTQESEAVVGPTSPATTPTTSAPVPVPVANEYSKYGNGAPFTIVLPGQLSTSQCPTGYQGANGVIVAIGTGTFTECWPTAAWEANRIGGNVWEQFKASGGNYDVMAEVTRRANVALLKSQAKSVAQTAADKTPGIQRCSKWTGYGETGEECAYTFIQPTGSNSSANGNTAVAISPIVSDSSTATTVLSVMQDSDSSTASTVPLVIQNSDTSTATTSASNSLTTSTSSILSSAETSKLTSVEEVKLAVTGTPKEIVSLISKVSASSSEAKTLTSLINKLATAVSKISTKSLKLPYSVSADESAKTLTPEVCSVKGVTVTSLKKGSCIIEYTVSGKSGHQFTISKTFEFKK